MFVNAFDQTHPESSTLQDPSPLRNPCGRLFAVGPKDVVNAFLEHLQMTWKTVRPSLKKSRNQLQLLGHHVGDRTQKTYTETLLDECKDVTPQRKRTTTSEPEYFDKKEAQPPLRRCINPDRVYCIF